MGKRKVNNIKEGEPYCTIICTPLQEGKALSSSQQKPAKKKKKTATNSK